MEEISCLTDQLFLEIKQKTNNKEFRIVLNQSSSLYVSYDTEDDVMTT